MTTPFLFVRLARGGVPAPATRTVTFLTGLPFASTTVIVTAAAWPFAGVRCR